MNIVFFSPNFPPNYFNFCVHLNNLGANVLGIGEEPTHFLSKELRQSLTDYFQVNDLHNYQELIQACGYFTYKYGKIDRIDSHNEYWLETEAKLRTDFNVFGLKTDQMEHIKKKSKMKKIFEKADVPYIRGQIVQNITEAQSFIEEVNYPVVIKPDIGVGAANTHKITSERELHWFFNQVRHRQYIIEEYIDGTIFSFDGLTDRDGNCVFYTVHRNSQGVMEVVNNDDHVYYYSLRDIPKDIDEMGHKLLKAFDVRERFFHFEFFRTPEDKLIALEVNMRPPGGLTVDMFNFANNVDLYREWANIMVHNRFLTSYSRPYHCCYVSRKDHKPYLYSHQDVLRQFYPYIVHHQAIPTIFSKAMGQHGYLIRTTSEEDLLEIAEFIHKLAM